MSEIQHRLMVLIEECTPDHGRFPMLAKLSQVPETSWKAFWYGRQRPTAEMIQVVARNWPEHAFWLATGLTDRRCGHRAPPGVVAYPEESVEEVVDLSAAYWKKAIQALEVLEARGELSFTERRELQRLKGERDDQVKAELSDTESEERELVKIIEHADEKPDDSNVTLAVKMLDELKRRQNWNDDDLCALFGIKPDYLAKIRDPNDPAPLPDGAKFRIFDKLGYVFMRDVFLACLPKGISMTLRALDQKNARRLLDLAEKRGGK